MLWRIKERMEWNLEQLPQGIWQGVEIKRIRGAEKGPGRRPTRNWKFLLACDFSHQYCWLRGQQSRRQMLWTTVYPQNVEALTPNVIFGNGDLWDPHISALIRTGRDTSAFCVWEHREKAAICKLGRKPLPGTKLASILILDFPGSRTVRNVCCLSLLVCDILL